MTKAHVIILCMRRIDWRHYLPSPTLPKRSIPYHGALSVRYEYQFVCALCQASHIETWLTCDTFSILYEKPSHLHLHLSKLCLQLAATNCRSWRASAATKKSNDYKEKHSDPRTLSLDLHFHCDDCGSERMAVEKTLLVYSGRDWLSIGVPPPAAWQNGILKLIWIHLNDDYIWIFLLVTGLGEKWWRDDSWTASVISKLLSDESRS